MTPMMSVTFNLFQDAKESREKLTAFFDVVAQRKL